MATCDVCKRGALDCVAASTRLAGCDPTGVAIRECEAHATIAARDAEIATLRIRVEAQEARSDSSER